MLFFTMNQLPVSWQGRRGVTSCNAPRKGYGKKMLALGIIKCKELGLDKVMVNCLVDNEASRKCILANKGVLLDKMYVEEKNYDIERYIINID